eukprot:12065079-Alexandrium_andersonii.AAC.1
MSASLVGSEMCIRDSATTYHNHTNTLTNSSLHTPTPHLNSTPQHYTTLPTFGSFPEWFLQPPPKKKARSSLTVEPCP